MSIEIKVEKLKPVADRVVIKVHPKENKTESGVYKPEAAKKSHQLLTGEIVAVGVGTPSSPMMLEVGDNVLYPEHVGTPIKGDLLIMKEGQVLTTI